MPSVAATSMLAFDASVGINTHDDLIGSVYQNVAAVENALSYIGVANVRDTYDFLNDPAEYKQIASDLGVKYDFYMALGSAGIPWQLAQIEADPSIVSYVEGYNESDNWWQSYAGQTGIAATAAAQQAVYAAVKADPQLSTVGVIQASFGKLSTFASYGDMSAAADDANTHSYFGTGNNPDGGGGANRLVALADTVTPGKPTITTEAGYFTMPGAADGVDQGVQAKYLLDLVFEQAKAGVSLTYLYELADNFADPGNTTSADHYGLFNADWTPKLAATALHNLMAITADPGTGGVAPGSLDYTLSGMPSTAMSTLNEKSDGTFVLALWNDVRLSGPTTQTDIIVTPVMVTLTLTLPNSTISIYDPLLGTTALQTFTNAQTVQIAVPDHPVIVEIGTHAGAATALPQIEAPGSVISMPADTVQVTGLAVHDATPGALSVSVTAGAGTLAATSPTGHVLAQGTRQVTLSGDLATVNAELASLTYTAGAAAGADTLRVQVQDGAGQVATQTIGVTVTQAVATTISGGALLSVPGSFVLAAGSTASFPTIVLSDLYAASHTSLVTLSAKVPAGTLLVAATGAAIGGNGTGALSLSGTFAQVSAALASLTYQAQAALGTTTIAFQVADAAGRVSSQAIAVTTVAPPGLIVPGAISASQSGATAIHGVSLVDGFAMAHVDAATVTLSDAHGLLAATGTTGAAVTGSGTTHVTLTGTVEQIDDALATLTTTTDGGGADTISVSASDGYGGMATASFTASLTGTVPPTVTLGSAARVFTAGTASLQGLVVGETADAGDAITVVVAGTLGTLAAGGVGMGVQGSGTGQVTLSGTLSQVNAALAGLTYTAGSRAGADTLSITVTDSAGASAASILPVSVFATPAAVAPGTAVMKSGIRGALPGFAINDSYAASLGGPLTATLSSIWGTLSADPAAGLTVAGSGTNTLTLTGNLATVDAALAAVSYVAGPAAVSDTVTLRSVNGLGGVATTAVTLAAAAPVTTVPSGLLVAPRTSTALNAISVSDAYAASRGGSLIVNISDIKAMSGTLRIVDTLGQVQTGTGAYALRLTGTLAQVNASLATLSYTAGAAYGTDQVQVNVWDPAGVSRTPVIQIGVGLRTVAIAATGGLQDVTGFTMTNGTILDLRQLMATTGWNGQTATLGRYLSVRASAGGSILSVLPGANGAAAHDVAKITGATVSLADVQLHGLLAPDATTTGSGVTFTDTGAASATVSGSAAAVGAVVAASPHSSIAATLADPGTNSVALLGWNNVLDAGPGMNFLNGLTPGDVFRANAAGQGLDTISGFSLSNGDVLDLHNALAGLKIAADLSNLGAFVTTAMSNGNTTVFVDPAGGGAHSSAIATLTSVTTDLPTLLNHHAVTI